MKKIIEATEHEILSRLTQAASGAGVALTHTHKLFFLRLLRFAEKNGDVVDDGLAIVLSVEGLAKATEIPFRTTIQCLNRLTSCGALVREVKKTFPRSTITLIPSKFYEGK